MKSWILRLNIKNNHILQQPTNISSHNDHHAATPRHVYTLGETVFDIIFKDEVPVTAKPGGSMLNTAVSLGRTGIPVSFISDYGQDPPGNLISDFLKKNNVSARFTDRFKDGNTAIALAFLDANRNAEYTFYKSFPAQRLNIAFPVIQPDDVVLFGSFYAITAEINEKIKSLIGRAREAGALIIYDPNFRRPHLAELESLRTLIVNNISMADIVKGSDEDFNLIFNAPDATAAYKAVRNAGCNLLIYTKNSRGVELITDEMHLQVDVPPITPVSTIGAGDSFSAGMIHAIIRKGIARKDLGTLSGDIWREVIGSGIRFASEVCMLMDNYVPEGFDGVMSYEFVFSLKILT